MIELLWRLNFDTIGSCQERSASKYTGLAYIALPIPGGGEALQELLESHGVQCTREAKIFGVRNDVTGEKIEIPCSHVYFPPNLMPEIEGVLTKTLATGASG